MTPQALTRRQLLASGAAAAAISCGPAPLVHASHQPASEPTIGIATFQFGTYSNAQLARELAAKGVTTVQLFLSQTDSNYWRYNGRSDLSDLTPDRCQRIAETYRDAGIAIHSMGVYTNLIHPDPNERRANLAYFADMMRIGAQMGVRTFVTEAGHYHNPNEPAPAVEYHLQESVWKMMVATGRELAGLARQHDATVLFEPYYRHFLASAKRTRVYLEEVGSPRLRALLDPANLLEVNDLSEMFDQLGPWIDCLHAKDRKLHVDRGVPAGQGDLDYPRFVRLAAERTPHAPLILEYVGPDNYNQALAHLRAVIAATG
jgi:sugar phosphate isomerase/epimerase